MSERWERMVIVALTIGIPLAIGGAGCQGHGPSAAAPMKKLAPPAAMAAKPAAQAAKPGATSGSPPSSGMIPGERPSHPPPAPPSTSRRSRFEVPQAKSLATTPDMILNTRVRASLMSALAARNTQDIEPETVNGVVTLTGTVKTAALRARAERVARTVRGVREVKNRLTVK